MLLQPIIGTPPYLGWTDEMARMLNDSRVVQYSERRHRIHTALDVLNEWRIENINGNRLWGIVSGPDFVGTLLARLDRINKTANLGILIGAEYWGNGYGHEAWGQTCLNLYHMEGIAKIEAGCMANNRGMIRILEKNKFKHEGTRKKHFQFDQTKRVDLVQYGRFYGRQSKKVLGRSG